MKRNCSTKSIVTITSQSNNKLSIRPKEGVGNDLHGAVDIMVGNVVDESNDETVPGAVVMMNKTMST